MKTQKTEALPTFDLLDLQMVDQRSCLLARAEPIIIVWGLRLGC
jgi:hypothetical protein